MHIEYTGNAPGTRLWTGPYTRYRYPFGRERTHGKVDIRDALKMLTAKIPDGTERLWRLYRASRGS